MAGVASDGDIEWIRARARSANVHPETFLATDYLNHFNEAVMLLELVPEMPDLMEDLAGWQLIGYEEHFRRAAFSGRDIAILAYAHSPDEFRKPFDEAIRHLAELIYATIDGVGVMVRRSDRGSAREIVRFAMPAIRRFQQTAGAIINGARVAFHQDAVVGKADTALDQSQIDNLMAR